MVKHHKCFWKAVSNMSDKKWERVKFILKFSIWLLIIGLILVLIFLLQSNWRVLARVYRLFYHCCVGNH